MEKELRSYITPNGKEPFEDWLLGLKDKITRARIRRRLDRLSEGHYGDVSSVGESVYELRFKFGPGYRIYFGEKEQTIIILLCGGDKSSQINDIKKAKEYWHDLDTRINNEKYCTETYI